MVVHVGAKSTIEPPDSLVLLLLALLLFWSALAQPVNSLLYLHFTFAWLISFKTIKIFPTGKAQRAIITSVFKLQGWTYSRGVLSLYWFLFENLSWSGCLCECVLEENWGKKKRESLNGLKFLKLSEAFFCCQMNQRNLHLQGGWIPFCSTLLLMPSEIFYCSLLVDLAADLPELWETAGSAKEPLGADNTRNSLIWNFPCVQYSSVVLRTFYGVYCKSVTVLCISDGCKGSVRTAAFNVAACQLMNSSAPPNLFDSCLPFGVQRHYFDMKGTGTGSIRIISASRNSWLCKHNQRTEEKKNLKTEKRLVCVAEFGWRVSMQIQTLDPWLGRLLKNASSFTPPSLQR